MVIANPQTGEIIALIGGRNTRYHGFNRALDTLRPIGSLIKPAVYLTAVNNGYSLVSQIDDSPFQLEMQNGQLWQPENFDKQSHGLVPLHQALSKSYNLSTARLGMSLGLDKVIHTMKQLGIKRPIDPYPSLLLGAQGLSPLEVATMYQTIAANGFQMPLRAIHLVTDQSGQELSHYPFQLRQTISPESIHLLQYMLQETARTGTARSIYHQLPADINIAGKTGTSDQQRDSWFAGFSGNRLAVTWLGMDDNSRLPFTGSSGALRAWTRYMAKESLQSFSSPIAEGIEYLWVDKESGMLSAETCVGTVQMPFLIGSGPTVRSQCIPQQHDFIQPSLDWIKRWFQ
jgi:penicillin-binding protein 1B